ncbi:hypothetical protein DL96DRAFT_1715964 [Flagelloscypha sp. PMI_526]|nr:hypothetical protein DL96DRAFT_1715964 [Flagelloscypha sp. PMI_526]
MAQRISLSIDYAHKTVSTKYLCVSGSGSAFKGSDGAPMIGLEQRARIATPSFIARTASWDPFVMYIVDITKPSGGVDAPPPPPPQPDYPSPPPNAISFSTNGSSIPIYYNQTVVDSATQAVGGGLQPRAKGGPSPGRQWNAGAHSAGQTDYYGQSEGSAPGSPSEAPSNEGGRVPRKRGRNTDRPARGGARRRAGSAGSGGGRDGDGPTAANGATWQVDVGETSVGPPSPIQLLHSNLPFTTSLIPLWDHFPFRPNLSRHSPASSNAFPPDRMAEAPKGHNVPPSAAKQLTLYGENFDKSEPVNVYFGTEPSSHVEAAPTRQKRWHRFPVKHHVSLVVLIVGLSFPLNSFAFLNISRSDM